VIVFVHGVPETEAIWRKVREGLDRPSMALSLPGFGNPRPEGFGATAEAYTAWIVEQLAAIDEPVDLVGHDWGACLTQLVADQPGDVIRSWAADIGNLLHPDYVWHPLAQIWQSTEGEAFFEQQQAMAEGEYAAGLAGAYGIDPADAAEMESAAGPVMASCILDLYRSATPNPFTRWGPWHPTTAPGCVLDNVGDPFNDSAMAAEVATMLGARVEVIEGANHFWPYTHPDLGIAALERFWSTLG
jgi:pimeloyl-ACP methyl ester carboxylesterase